MVQISKIICVLALVASVHVQADNRALSKSNAAVTPSIMFVIDNSASMNDPKNPTDPTNVRFTVVSKLLDSIYQTNSKTRVGFAAFNARLSFDYRDNKIFQGLWPDDPTQHDSYVPLMSLDSTFGNSGIRALDTLKALLKTDVNGNLLYNTKRNMERVSSNISVPFPMPHRNGTDITLGFLAALQAMKSSPSPKESQFIIFLSDGEAVVLDNIRKANQDDYLAGVNTPTTFTIFFNPQNSQAPLVNMTTMTNNIKANGYSSSNPSSALYNINLPSLELLSILQNNIFSTIFPTGILSRKSKAIYPAMDYTRAGEKVNLRFASGFVKRDLVFFDLTGKKALPAQQIHHRSTHRIAQ